MSKKCLKALEELKQNIKDRVILAEDRQLKLCAIIEQAIIKAQEQEKALKIMFEKYVDVDFLKSAYNVEEYNKLIKFKVFLAIELTEEEFNLLKRYA